ncbi:hypothetical protein ACFL2C_04400, partial [Patescibacteria group bacterium]
MSREKANYYSEISEFSLAGHAGGQGPDNAHRTVGVDAESLSAIRGITATLARAIEPVATGHWAGVSKYFPYEFWLNEREVVTSLARLRSILPPSTLQKNVEMDTYYQSLTEPPEIPIDSTEEIYPDNPDLEILFRYSEKFDIPLNTMFHSLPGHGNVIHPNFRYLVETAMTVAQIAFGESPIEQDHQLMPNVHLHNSGKPVTQFDGVMVPNHLATYPEPCFSMDSLWQSQFKGEWGLLEVKTLFRTRHVTGEMRKPRNWDTRDVQAKLARAAIDREGNITLPKFVQFVYPRGLRPTLSFTVPITH